TLHARNGTLQTCHQVPLAHPQKWGPFVQDVAGRSGCAAEPVVAAIRELTEAIEVFLRVHRTPPAKAKQGGVHGNLTEHPLVQVNGRILRDIVTDAVAALVTTNEPPTLFIRGSELVRVPSDAAHATPLSVAVLRVLLDHAADFMEVRWDADEGEIRIPARPPRDVCERSWRSRRMTPSHGSRVSAPCRWSSQMGDCSRRMAMTGTAVFSYDCTGWTASELICRYRKPKRGSSMSC
nr:hypothetical protein [Candidatus Tectomicrobia bacterium]